MFAQIFLNYRHRPAMALAQKTAFFRLFPGVFADFECAGVDRRCYSNPGFPIRILPGTIPQARMSPIEAACARHVTNDSSFRRLRKFFSTVNVNPMREKRYIMFFKN